MTPQPRPGPDGLPLSVEEEWWAETEPAGAPPAAADQQTEEEPIAGSDEQDRALDGLFGFARRKTRTGRIRGMISRWLGGEDEE